MAVVDVAKTMTTVKISVEIPYHALAALRELAEKRGTTVTNVLLASVSTEAYLDKVRIEEGQKVLLEDRKGKIKELIFER
jgi:hypothetical protein